MTEIAAIAILTSIWCAVHSLVLTPRFQEWMRRRLGPAFAGTRLAYVVFSTVTFLALSFWVHGPASRVIWAWSGWWQIVRVWLLATGVVVTILGARVYDQSAFLGLRQIAALRAGRRLPPERLEWRGILAHLRHPYYAAAFPLLLGYADFTTRNLVFRVALMLYLVIGTEWEERKLLREHGDAYARYRREVPRFWPRWRPARNPRRPEEIPTDDAGI